jgi:hypothetical protein
MENLANTQGASVSVRKFCTIGQKGCFDDFYCNLEERVSFGRNRGYTAMKW